MNTTEKRVLVTGGFGFIGSHLVEQLLQDKSNRVHVVDDLSTSPVEVEEYTSQVPHPAHLTWSICTVKDYFLQNDLPAFDEVFHLANVVGPVGVLKHAGDIVRKTVEDTYAIADYAATSGASLCDVSTSEVYGGGRDGYCSEKDSMIITPKTSVRLEYAVAKLACEVALMNQSISRKLNVVVIRPFNVAGPRQSSEGGFVLPRFISQALAGEDITVYGDGQMVRAFTHVADVADGIIRALRRGRSGQVYNIGNPANRTNILHLAEEVIRVSASRSKIVFVDPKKLWGPLFEEANDKYPDADRAMNDLEWRPRHSLVDTIRDAMRYIKHASPASGRRKHHTA
jgi:nucleoside-diphosphate-sugar epimerase